MPVKGPSGSPATLRLLASLSYVASTTRSAEVNREKATRVIQFTPSQLRLVGRSSAGRVQSLNRAASRFEGVDEEDVLGTELGDRLSQRLALGRTEPEVPEWVDEDVTLY